MYLFRPNRHLLKQKIKEVSHHIRGKTIDVGAGEIDRYGSYFATTEYVRMEPVPRNDIDIVGSIYKIPFPDNSFDSVVCTQVFEHLAYPVKAVEEIKRVLKKGGCALITVPQMSALHEEPSDFFRYTKYGLESLFADFELMEMKRLGNYYATLAELKISFWCDTWRLHDRPIIGRVAGKLINWYGRYMLWRESDTPSSLQHTIGWVAIFKKIK
jgi:SAM-dependent methyltransferase